VGGWKGGDGWSGERRGVWFFTTTHPSTSRIVHRVWGSWAARRVTTATRRRAWRTVLHQAVSVPRVEGARAVRPSATVYPSARGSETASASYSAGRGRHRAPLSNTTTRSNRQHGKSHKHDCATVAPAIRPRKSHRQGGKSETTPAKKVARPDGIQRGNGSCWRQNGSAEPCSRRRG